MPFRMKQLDEIQEHATVDLMQNKFWNLISKIGGLILLSSTTESTLMFKK